MNRRSLLLATLAITPLLSEGEPFPKVDLKGKDPEDFDWLAYLGEAQSTVEKMVRAQDGIKQLEARLDTLCEASIKLLESRGLKDSVDHFRAMQDHWKKAADHETALVGLAWAGGSGQKAETPSARLHCYLRRVKELKALKARCMSLNE